MEQVYAAGNSAASQFEPLKPIAPALTPVFAAQLKGRRYVETQQKMRKRMKQRLASHRRRLRRYVTR
jgi:hypothetical protein